MRTLILSSLLVIPMSTISASELVFDPDLRADDSVMGKTIRKQFVNSLALPDGVAFLAILRTVHSMAFDEALGWITTNTGFDAASSQMLYQRMIPILAEYEAEFDKRAFSILCNHATSKYGGSMNFEMLEKVDDTADSLANTYWRSFIEGMNAEAVERLKQWVDNQKRDTVHTLVNHQELANMASVASDVDNEVSAICSRLQSRQ